MPDAVREIPLRLNKRRDGSLVLTNALGIGGAEDREFPPEHVFGFEWMATGGADVVRLEGSQVVLSLANGKAVYDITERGAGGVRGTLVSTDLFDAPAIDESRAAEIAGQGGGPAAVDSGSYARGGSIHIEVPNEGLSG